MRELFSACDTSEDGQIDLSEFVQAQMHLAEALGDVFDRRVATHRFYSMQNARLGRVSFSGFFRAEVKRLQDDADVNGGPPRAEWPTKLLWCANQIRLGQRHRHVQV